MSDPYTTAIPIGLPMLTDDRRGWRHRGEDLGMHVSRAAGLVTPEQVAEMMAIRMSMFHPNSRCGVLAMHSKTEPMKSLIQGKLVQSVPCPRTGRHRHLYTLTEVGERVLLAVAEHAMVQTGAMAQDELPDDD